MKIEIKSIWGSVLFSNDAETLRDAVVAAVKSRANLSGADLSRADLYGANLYGANLYEANLSGANLYGAKLYEANLSRANLYGSNLSRADLSGADLYGADLYGSNLSEADLSRANLYEANLSRADLSGANLYEAKIDNTTKGLLPIVPEVGSFVGFKKLSNGTIAKLLIPEDAERIGGYTGRKCRASKAIVLEGAGASSHNPKFTYAPGEIITPDKWDNDPRVECSSGIHFFLTRREAEEY